MTQPPQARPDPPAHIIRLVVGMTYGADTPVANTFWVRNGGAEVPSQGTLDAYADFFGNKFASNFAPQLSQGLFVTNCDAWYYGTNGIALASQRAVSAQGGKPGVHLPSNVAICVGWRVAQHYKGGHPRTYLCGPAPDALSGGRRFLQTYCDAVRGAANQLQLDANGGTSGALQDLHLGTVSFVNKKAYRNPPIFRDYVVGGAHVDSRVDSMRRRLGRDIPP